MKPLSLVLAFLCLASTLHAQFVYTIKADSVKITNNCDTAELILENHTQNVLGFLYNKGRGRTEFRKIIKLNDSTLIFGDDTLVIQGSAITTASNGLSITGNNVQLGQSVEDAENPSVLNESRVIPFNGNTLTFRGNFTDSTVFSPFRIRMTGNTHPARRARININNDGEDYEATLGADHFQLYNFATSNTVSMNVIGTPVFGIADFQSSASLSYQTAQLELHGDSILNSIPHVGAIDINGMRTLISSTPTNGQLNYIDGLFQDTIQIKGFPDHKYLTIGDGTNVYLSVNNGSLNVRDSILVGKLRTGSSTDSLVVWDNNSKALKKIAQANISNVIYRVPVNDANYTATTSDYLIAYIAISTSRTVTLPAASSMINKTIMIKDESGSAATHNINIDGFGSETIDGSLNKTININFGSMTIYSNGASWFTIHS